jgi:lipoprotein-anchoring transpeptidase ErfK/SrfK
MRVLVAMLSGLLLLVTGCGSAFEVRSTPPPATIVASVSPGSSDVGINAPLMIIAQDGTLSQVRVTGDSGAELAGTFSPDHTRWTSGPLEFGTAYAVSATGADSGGKAATPLNSTFHTTTPKHTLEVMSIRPSAGQQVGVAMPISINFTTPVRDKASVERALSVHPSVPTEGSFHWLTSQRVDWRPKEFWKPNTGVRVDLALRGVSAGGGTYGRADRSSEFSIGSPRSAVGDAAAHTLTLFEGDRPVRTMPASFGQPKYQTHSGIHVVMSKELTRRMRSDSWVGGPKEGEPGFYDEVLPLAVRISNNGEFVHVNNLTVSAQGRRNVSHGCVNLNASNGKFFYDWAQQGDPVTITNTTVPLSASEGDISSWVYNWADYQAGSALTNEPAAPKTVSLPGMPPGYTPAPAKPEPTLFAGMPTQSLVSFDQPN